MPLDDPEEPGPGAHEDDGSESSSDDDEDETADLLAELQRIKQERAAEQARKVRCGRALPAIPWTTACALAPVKSRVHLTDTLPSRRQEAEKAAEAERARKESILQGNPLLAPPSAGDFSLKRRWDEDVVFKHCARQTDEPEVSVMAPP